MACRRRVSYLTDTLLYDDAGDSGLLLLMSTLRTNSFVTNEATARRAHAKGVLHADDLDAWHYTRDVGV
jgi:hypothetical protein